MSLKQGDLVKPLGSCGGQPGAKRCNIAMVLEPWIGTGHDRFQAKIVCPCGVNSVYRTQLEKIEPELAYSADPM